MRSRVQEPPRIGRGCSTAEAGVVEYRLDRIRSYGPIAGRWLDCGCAEGDYSVALAQAGADAVVGTDIEEPRIAEASSRWSSVEGVSFVATPAEELPFGADEFDAALLNEVLEHVADQERTLGEIRRVLRPGGTLFLFSPNRRFPFEGHGAVLGPVKLWFPIPLHPWLPQRMTARTMTARNYWPSQLAGIVRDAGLDVVAVDYALPLFTKYEWLPRSMRDWYARSLPRIDGVRLLRSFGVSTVIVARKPADGDGSG